MDDARLVVGFDEVCKILLRAWTVRTASWLEQHDPRLGMRPLDALERGELTAVLAAARVEALRAQ